MSTVIDGSVTNIISGVGAATEAATAATATARSFTLPTVELGNIATTTLGAVNTGDITVGVNSAVDEAAASTTRAIQASLTVVGGSAEAGTMMLNIAHNTSIIRGNVDNMWLDDPGPRILPAQNLDDAGGSWTTAVESGQSM